MIDQSRLHHAAIFFVLAIVTSACSAPTQVVAPQASLQPVNLKVGTSAALSFAPFYIADTEGYFAQQGITVEFPTFTSTKDALAALEQGQLDVLGGNVSPAYFSTVGRGARMKLVADKGYISATGCTDTALLARKSLFEAKAFDDPNKLRGMKSSSNTVDVPGYLTDKALNAKGLTLDDLQIGNALLPDPVISDGFAKGTLDFAWANEPSVTRFLEEGNAVIWVAANSFMPDYSKGLVIYGPNLLDKNPDVGRRFMLAYLKAVRQYNQGKTDRNMEIISKVTKLDRAFLQKACWPPIRIDGKIVTAPLFDFQAWAVKRKLVDNAVPDEKTLYDPSFIDYANQVLGPAAQ